MTDVEIECGLCPPNHEPSYYPCKFPFTHQGVEHDKCISVSSSTFKSFCAIEVPEHGPHAGDGHECPKCWKNETYKVGYCADLEKCNIVPSHSGSNGKLKYQLKMYFFYQKM